MSPEKSTPPPDAEIVRSLSDRTGDGLHLLLEAHGAHVRTALRRAMGSALDDSEIDEAMSTAAYNAWRKADSFDPERGSLRAWFFVIARNAARAILRERQRLAWQRDDVDRLAGEVAAQPADPAADDGFLQTLRMCIAQLPKLQRRIIEADLRSGDVASASELARRFRTSTNSIYVSRNSARRSLRRALAQQGFGAEQSEASTWA